MLVKKSTQYCEDFRFYYAYFTIGTRAQLLVTVFGRLPLNPIISIQYYQSIFKLIYASFLIMLKAALKINYNFAQLKLLTNEAYLKIRNSETLELLIPIPAKQKAESIIIPRIGTLADITKPMMEKFDIKQIEYLCNQKIRMPESTPINILLNRYFYIASDQYYLFSVEGELFDYGKSDQVVEGIISLQLPAVTKKEVENYLARVNRWVQFYTGKNILDQTTKIDSKTVAKIFVESAIDPQPQDRRILLVQKEWERLYWLVADLRKKKREADDICLKQVRRKMSWGLMFLGANIAFIWSGTYIFYSWDIIQPLAYFTSSLAAIILAGQFFKLGRPYSNYAYQQYLMDRLAPKVYKQVGFSMQELSQAEYQLIQMESIIKDFYLKRL